MTGDQIARTDDEILAEATQELVEICERLLDAWDVVYPQLGRIAAPDSPASRDANAFRAAHPDAPRNVEHAAGQFAGRYLSAVGQHLRGLVALLRGNATTLSAWPVIRAELESAGRIAWLLEPGTEADPRVARWLMEELIAHCRARLAASKRGRRDEEGIAKAERDRCRQSIDQLFTTAQYDWAEPGTESAWVVNGEKFQGLGRTNDLFLGLASPATRGLYDFLSDLSHPSVVSLHRQTKMLERDGVAELFYFVPLDILRWQVQLACGIYFKAAQLIAEYFGIDIQPLMNWTKSTPGWFEEGPAEDSARPT